ncbi:acyl-CoA/acyl-ACP dehydrogenase [Sphingomonas sp. RP10(2022)]|uniref:Acyl-CoA/acyl-ACP dehydrogenase n=1 Tax=Sphingomonas liriopis TaxID=2949094 RepID=A0A9X2HZK6_9SPHN|nr:acyl-CoA dehydrogenase family protein [Sphingomonas liriopis]MCP3735755.1 acyl-CoA/acyl-ACP dehydrogenase [Sphingomonas liriopis]
MTDMAIRLRAAIAAAGWDHAPPRDPRDAAEYLAILRPLHATGRRDLPLGRLLEGHVDAGQIVQRYGNPDQVARLRHALAGGAMLGVWNAALPGEPLALADGRLRGAKSYASGAGVLTHALVTAQGDGGTRLLLLDLAATPPVVDRDWWRTTGMQRSETHRVRWPDVAVDDDAAIGEPDSYAREPYFSGGALRFVAVHAGGIAGLCDQVRDHLVATGRADDPFQAARLAEAFWLADQAAAFVRRAAVDWFEHDGEARLARIAATRLAVTDAAERAIALAQAAVGLAGQFLDHPLSALLADLAVYLRQPAPDAQRLRVGRAVRDGLLSPSL